MGPSGAFSAQRRSLDRACARSGGYPVQAPDSGAPSPLRAVLAVDGSFVPIGEGWNHLLGWQPGDLAGSAFIERVHPDDQEMVIAAIHAVYAAGAAASLSCRYARKDGSYLWLSWLATPRPGGIELELTGGPVA